MDTKTAKEILNEAKLETDPLKKSEKLYNAIYYLFKAGSFKEGLQYIDKINDPSLFIKLVTDEYVFSKFFEKGKKTNLIKLITKADKALKDVNDLNKKLNLTIKVADCWFKIGLIQNSRNLILPELEKSEKSNNNYITDEVKSNLVDILSKLGEYKKARLILNKINDEKQKALGLLYIVKAACNRFDLNEAIMVANEINDTIQKSNAFTYIAVGFLKEGNISEAKKVLELIKVPSWREKVRYWIINYFN